MTDLSPVRRTPLRSIVLRTTIMLTLVSVFASLAAAPAQAAGISVVEQAPAVSAPQVRSDVHVYRDEASTINDLHYTYLPLTSNGVVPLHVSVTASVDQPSSPECRRTFTFTGSIALSGPGTIKYQWEMSSSTTPVPGTIDFTQAGAQEVYHLWPVTEPSSGWARLRILSPMPAVSQPVPYQLACNKPKLAYVYSTDTSSRDEFYKFFFAQYEVDRVALHELVDHPNAAQWTKIVIGHDTRWVAGSPETEKIKNLNRPVLGVGEGGRSLFQAIGLDIGANGWQASGKEVVPVNPQDQFWHGITSSATVPLYTSDTSLIAVNNPQAKRGFLRIGRQTPSADTTHYPIVAQERNGQCHKLWGFIGTPNLLTAQGKQLLTNLLNTTTCPETITELKLTIQNVRCITPLETSFPDGDGDEVSFELEVIAANGYQQTASTTVRNEVGPETSYTPMMLQQIQLSDPAEWLQINLKGTEHDAPPEIDDGQNMLSGTPVSLTRDQLFQWFGTTGSVEFDLQGSDNAWYKVAVAVTVE